MPKLNEQWLAVGFFTASAVGCTLAVTNFFSSWNVFQKCAVIEIPMYGAHRDCQTLTLKTGERVPQGYQLIDRKNGYPDIKLIGLAVAVTAGIASYAWNQRLSDLLEIAEAQAAQERQADNRVFDKGLNLHTQLQERRLTMEMGEKAKEFERLFGVPNLPTLDDDQKQEDYLNAEFPADRAKQDSPRTPNADMLYGWLLARNMPENEVRTICRSSIEGHTLSAEQARSFLDELAGQQLIEWLNDQKTKFKLITGD